MPVRLRSDEKDVLFCNDLRDGQLARIVGGGSFISGEIGKVVQVQGNTFIFVGGVSSHKFFADDAQDHDIQFQILKNGSLLEVTGNE